MAILRDFAITLFALLNALGMLPIFIGYNAGERKQVQRLFPCSWRPRSSCCWASTSSTARAAAPPAPSLADADPSSILQAKSVHRQIVIPMAMPLLVGPGVIANVILDATEAADRHKDDPRFELILVTAVVCMLVFLVLASGSRLQRLLGDIGLSITQRVMGLFVAAIGMQCIVTGVVDVFVTQIVPRLRS